MAATGYTTYDRFDFTRILHPHVAMKIAIVKMLVENEMFIEKYEDFQMLSLVNISTRRSGTRGLSMLRLLHLHVYPMKST